MRCVGAHNPPCERCLRTGKKCVVQPSRRGQQQPAQSLRRQKQPPQPSDGSVSEPHSLLSSPKELDQGSHLGESGNDHNYSRSRPLIYSSTSPQAPPFAAAFQSSRQLAHENRITSRSDPPASAGLVDIPDEVLCEYVDL
jgi:hypothetical protein